MQTMPRDAFRLKQRTCYWRSQLFTADAMFGAAFFGAIAQATDDPVEWPQGADGYGRRVGTRYAQSMIKSSGTFLVSLVSREDPRPKPVQVYPGSPSLNGNRDTAFGCRQAITYKGRLGQSLLRTVWDACRDKPWKRPKPGRLGGSFASGFAGLMWAPPSVDHISNALSDSGTAFGGYVAESVISEFSPDISRLVGHLVPTGRPKTPKKPRTP
jgi:hypothetical protein